MSVDRVAVKATTSEQLHAPTNTIRMSESFLTVPVLGGLPAVGRRPIGGAEVGRPAGRLAATGGPSLLPFAGLLLIVGFGLTHRRIRQAWASPATVGGCDSC